MQLINYYNKKTLNNGVFKPFSRLMCVIFASCVLNAQSQDLLSGNDLKDSPLSLSLSTGVTMPVDNHVQHIRISQYGISNEATINQLAHAGNGVVLSQFGNDNLANIIQSGLGNTVNLEQLGDSNQAKVIQEGNANVANIRQEGEQRFFVHQIGNDMEVNITQY